jgi:hypothetical protein
VKIPTGTTPDRRQVLGLAGSALLAGPLVALTGGATTSTPGVVYRTAGSELLRNGVRIASMRNRRTARQAARLCTLGAVAARGGGHLPRGRSGPFRAVGRRVVRSGVVLGTASGRAVAVDIARQLDLGLAASRRSAPVVAPVVDGTRSWRAGYSGDVTAAGQAAFARRHGFAAQAVSGFCDEVGDWGTIEGFFGTDLVSFFPASDDPGAPINLITLGLVLDRGVDSDSAALRAAALGADVASWTAVGASIRSHGMNARNTVIRLGHEANGTWYPWSTGGDPLLMGAYRAAWRHAVTAIGARAPRVRFELCLNASGPGGGSGSGGRVLAGHYAGDDVVDIVGFDVYNFGDDADRRGLLAEAASPGFADVPAFCHAHRKLFSVSEWGLDGDDPDVTVRDRADWVAGVFTQLAAVAATYPGIISHELYFDEHGLDPPTYFALADNPRSAAAYRARWA